MDENIQIQAVVENKTSEPKTVTCILTIENAEGFLENINWAVTNLESNSITDISQSWRPNTEGNYIAKIYIWEQIHNRVPLTETRETSFVVYG